ncbi:hypothetical protein Leryth_026392 [Lithospermum erythrorhizon]|nr:hypothetical protein Leryth_026392 [Lithospermum erythrorhizon]
MGDRRGSLVLRPFHVVFYSPSFIRVHRIHYFCFFPKQIH